MDGIWTVSMIDESDDSFTALLHHESRSWDNAVVSDMACFLARIDLKVNWLDVDLVIINVVVLPR